ncbi:MAG: thiamine pyrophosphate-dependent enzyme, partial [Thermodesulfobacteriota bacterium]
DTFGWIRGESVLAKDFDPFATEFSCIDYLKIAEGFGLKSFAVKDPGSLEETLQLALSEPGPSFVLLKVTSQDKLVPPVPKWVEGARGRNLPYVY